jgi:hypothetical protein
MQLRAPIALAVFMSLAASPRAAAQGTPIAIANAGFESPAIPADSFATLAPPPGWSGFGTLDFGARTIGVLDPGASGLYPLGVPEGENCGVVFLLDNLGNQAFFANQPAGLAQTLAATLATSTRYTLRVEVGNLAFVASPPHSQFQFNGFPGYRVELLAGGQVVASDVDTLNPAEGAFETSQVVFEVGASHPLAGQPLGIRLINLNAAPGIEVNFDAVELFADDFFEVLPGCLVNPAAFTEPPSPVRIGTTTNFALQSGALSNGIVATYYGVRGVDLAGCGLLLSPTEELLLALAPFPTPLGFGVLSGGSANVAVSLPNDLALVGIEVTLQAALVDTSTFASELSNAIEFEIRP